MECMSLADYRKIRDPYSSGSSHSYKNIFTAHMYRDDHTPLPSQLGRAPSHHQSGVNWAAAHREFFQQIPYYYTGALPYVNAAFCSMHAGVLVYGVLGESLPLKNSLSPKHFDILHRLTSNGPFALKIGTTYIMAKCEPGVSTDRGADIYTVTFPTGFPTFASSFNVFEAVKKVGKQDVVAFGELLPPLITAAGGNYSCWTPVSSDVVLETRSMITGLAREKDRIAQPEVAKEVLRWQETKETGKSGSPDTGQGTGEEEASASELMKAPASELRGPASAGPPSLEDGGEQGENQGSKHATVEGAPEGKELIKGGKKRKGAKKVLVHSVAAI